MLIPQKDQRVEKFLEGGILKFKLGKGPEGWEILGGGVYELCPIEMIFLMDNVLDEF